MTTKRTELHCGCRPGFVVCGTAQSLWANTWTTYHQAIRTNSEEDWYAYDMSRLTYEEHARQQYLHD